MENYFDDILLSTDDDEEFQAGTHLEIFSDTSGQLCLQIIMLFMEKSASSC
jgi:hypothetical protein